MVVSLPLNFPLAKDAGKNGGLNPLNTAVVAGKHPRLIAFRQPGHPFVSGRQGQLFLVVFVLKISEATVQTL